MVVSVRDFQTQVLEPSRRLPAIVDFWAEWCGPCKAFTPVLEQEASLNEDRWFLAKVNIDEHQALAQALRVQSIPTVAMIYQEKVISSFSGLVAATDFRKWVADFYPDTRDKSLLHSARLLWVNVQPEDALESLQAFLNDYPDDEEALAQYALWTCLTHPERAIQYIQNISEASAFYDTAQAVRDLTDALVRHNTTAEIPEHPAKANLVSALHALHQGELERALQQLIESLYRGKDLDGNRAVKVGIALFKYWGEKHPLTMKYRRLFDMAMY